MMEGGYGKQIVVHSIDHASYTPQLVKCSPHVMSIHCEANYREGDILGGVCSYIKAIGLSQPLQH